MHFVDLILLRIDILLESPHMLLNFAEVRLALVDIFVHFVIDVSHVIVVVTEREEMLYFVDHLVAATQDRRKSLQFFHIILSEAMALLD